jgi:hypothetical protein
MSSVEGAQISTAVYMKTVNSVDQNNEDDWEEPVSDRAYSENGGPEEEEQESSNYSEEEDIEASSQSSSSRESEGKSGFVERGITEDEESFVVCCRPSNR